MLIVLPLICFGLMFRVARPLNCWRKQLLISMTACGLAVVLITEMLGVFRLLNRGPVSLAWVVLGAALGGWLWRSPRDLSGPRPRAALGRPTCAMIAVLAVGVLLLLMLGIVAAPNNADSMVYHMPRVVHWMQEASVADFPTHFAMQIYQPPFAEFCILHLQVLSGGDRFANLVQWAAMVGSLLGVSYLACRFGAGVPAQVLAAVVAFSIPMGILQASSTQNNHVVALWLVTFVVWALEAMVAEEGRRRNLFLTAAGVSLGLALLTKGTVFAFALPFCAWFAIAFLHNLGWRSLAPILWVGTITCAINAGHWSRNYASCGSALAPAHERSPGGVPVQYLNGVFTPRAIVSNVIRNVALQIAPAGRGAAPLSRMVRRIHRWIGADPDDPRTTFEDYRFSIPTEWKDEDFASNPIHLLLAVAAVGLYCLTPPARDRRIRGFALSIGCAFLTFCVLFRWQPFHSRLHLPLFVLSAPLIALAIERTWPDRGVVAVSTLLMLCSAVWIFGNEERPMLGAHSVLVTARESQYFRNDANTQHAFDQTVAQIREQRFTRVGIGGFCWEYPLWVLLKRADPNIRIEHVHVHNYTAALQNEPYFRDFIPQEVVTFENSAGSTRARLTAPDAEAQSQP